MSIENRKRVAHIVAGRTGPSAVFPIARPGVVDAEQYMAVVAVRVVAARAGFEGQVETLALNRVELGDDISHDIVSLPSGPNPGAHCEVASAKLQGGAGRDFHEARAPVKLPL